MTETSRLDQARLAGHDRLFAAALAFGLLCPLAVASSLEPDNRGRGTHQQLRLPPCTFSVVFGMRCPTCGMTTSWAHLVRGRLVDALRANVAGTLLCLLGLAGVPWLLSAAVGGRWLGWTPNSTTFAWIAAGIMAVSLIEWSVRLLAG